MEYTYLNFRRTNKMLDTSIICITTALLGENAHLMCPDNHRDNNLKYIITLIKNYNKSNNNLIMYKIDNYKIILNDKGTIIIGIV